MHPLRISLGFGSFVIYAFAIGVLTLSTFWTLRLLNMPLGNFIDWTIATVTLWWLLIIVTVPWNIYFEAKSVSAEAEHSQSIHINIDADQLKYVRKIEINSLTAALLLHLLSAACLFALSYFGVTPVGYIGCAAALLLTLLRPSVRGYEYLREKLNAIKNRFRYPREDVLELRNRTASLENNVAGMLLQLNMQDPASFAAKQFRLIEDIKQRQTTLLEEMSRMDDDNIRDHERISREGKSAIAKISADSQFLDHVREIVQMIKSA